MFETVAIDAAGRLVVPRQHRRRLGLTGAGRVQIRHIGDHVELRVVTSAISWRRADDGLPVLESEEPLPPLPADEVRAALLSLDTRAKPMYRAVGVTVRFIG